MPTALHRRAALLFCLALCLARPCLAATPATAPAPESASAPLDPAALETQFQSIAQPDIDEAQLADPAYRTAAQARVSAYYAQRATIAAQIMDISPNDTNAITYLDAVFTNFNGTQNLKGAVQFAERLLTKTTDSTVKRESLYMVAFADLNEPSLQPGAAAAIDQFVTAAPNDERVPSLLIGGAQSASSAADQKRFGDRLTKDFPDSDEAQMLAGVLYRRQQVGNPFALSFTDAIGGQPVDIRSLKGKIVVVDFWATWCGPCVAAMPDLKRINDAYKDKGVVFVGVSLDKPPAEGGLDALKAFVHDSQIPWPQFYQGNGWESAFSASWKIESIPQTFVVDGDGLLASADAFGKLDTLLPAMIAKRGQKQ